ncbi:hypothetical protein SEUBUCD646_0N02220 [Saccharomyces eubayanus]|nr:hypothetical protein SEUBUCD646_0N02220 [Saccharomyces eubayanus]
MKVFNVDDKYNRSDVPSNLITSKKHNLLKEEKWYL